MGPTDRRRICPLHARFPEEALVYSEVLSGIAAENYFFNLVGPLGKCLDRGHCSRRRKLKRIRVGADRRERNGFEFALGSQPKRGLVTGGQQFGFTPMPIFPNRSDRMDDPARCEPIRASDAGLAGRTSTESAAFLEKLWSSGMVDRPVHSATTKQRGIRGIHNRIDVKRRDVPTYCAYSSNHGLTTVAFYGIILATMVRASS
jgi:hypothetical protein